MTYELMKMTDSFSFAILHIKLRKVQLLMTHLHLRAMGLIIAQAGRRLVRSLTNSIRHLCFHVYMH